MNLDDLHNEFEQELHDQETAFTAHDQASGLNDASYKPEDGLDFGSTVNPQTPEDLFESIESEALKGTLNNLNNLNNLHAPGTPSNLASQRNMEDSAFRHGESHMDNTFIIKEMDGRHSSLISASSQTNAPNNFVYEEGTYEAYASHNGTHMTVDDASREAGNVISGMFSGNSCQAAA